MDIHFLLTYTCTYECDHCFLYCSPKSEGTFTISQIKEVLNEATKIGTEWIFFEGGEPFLYYPIMLEGIRIAHEMGFKTGIVTNSYWATSVEDAEIWLKPISESGISNLSISEDLFHFESLDDSPAEIVTKAARNLGIYNIPLCVIKPTAEDVLNNKQDILFKGRAVEKSIEGLPKKPWKDLITCPYENLRRPGRIHIDSFGNVHICQGLSMGNMWKIPLSVLINNYDGESHPICGPLIKGGPALLAKEYNVDVQNEYVDECHLCYLVRLALIDKFPDLLTPRQVYGLE